LAHSSWDTCIYIYIYIYIFQNAFLLCSTPRLYCFLSSHWPSLYLSSSFTSVFLVLSFVSASTSMLFWVIFLLTFSEHGRACFRETYQKHAPSHRCGWYEIDSRITTTIIMSTNYRTFRDTALTVPTARGSSAFRHRCCPPPWLCKHRIVQEPREISKYAHHTTPTI
jgi:hypothetical protein